MKLDNAVLTGAGGRLGQALARASIACASRVALAGRQRDARACLAAWATGRGAGILFAQPRTPRPGAPGIADIAGSTP